MALFSPALFLGSLLFSVLKIIAQVNVWTSDSVCKHANMGSEYPLRVQREFHTIHLFLIYRVYKGNESWFCLIAQAKRKLIPPDIFISISDFEYRNFFGGIYWS